MINFILKCYEDYKIFMDIEPKFMPGIIPVEKSFPENINSNDPLAYINKDEIGNNSINIYYNSKLSQNSKDYIKAILYHEFTHIYDGVILKSLYNDEQLTALMTTYSEYHASQIELACKIHFENIHSFHKINLDKTFVSYENETHKIEMDYIHPMADSLVIIQKPNDYYHNLSCVEYFKFYKIFESKTMYYLGKKNFCEKYSIKRIPDITKQHYGDFYPYIHEIENCIKNKLFDKILISKKQLFKKYISVFTLNDRALSILKLTYQ